jgi:hypothetical protein
VPAEEIGEQLEDDRLGRMAKAALDTLEQMPEYREGDHLLVMYSDAAGGTTVFTGYEKMSDVFSDLYTQAGNIATEVGFRLLLVNRPDLPANDSAEARSGRLTQALVEKAAESPDFPVGDRLAVLVTAGEGGRVALAGYDGGHQLLEDLLEQAQRVAEKLGIKLITVDGSELAPGSGIN